MSATSSTSPVKLLDGKSDAINARHHLPPPIGGFTFLRHVRSALSHDTFVAEIDASHELCIVRVYALEYLRRDEERRNAVEREVLASRVVHHPHIAEVFAPFATRTDLFVPERFYSGGDLFEAMESYNRSVAANLQRRASSSSGSAEPPAGPSVYRGLPVTVVKRVVRDLLSGLQYLHEECGMAHRNIKLENILLDDHNRVRLTGFGLCAVLPRQWCQTQPDATAANSEAEATTETSEAERERMLKLSCGAKHYIAPEMVQGKPYDGTAVDVWAAGVVLFAILTGCFPFDSDNSDDELFTHIRHADRVLEEHVDFRALPDPQAQDLLRNLLRVNPLARFSAAEALEHPFLTEAA